ncbi:MAG: FGGY family carbohydrate kinase [Bacteroidales bacterium]
MLLLGIDLGSSSVKASVLDGETGDCLASAFMPANEMKIIATQPGWAEQEPDEWWKNLVMAVRKCTDSLGNKSKSIGAIGISYQMHGLVVVDRNHEVLRPSIIWCDSRAVPYGKNAYESLGKDFCQTDLLNSPGNFTASKLAWVKHNEKKLYDSIHKIMLPGDYVAMKLTGYLKTTYTGLSEGILWNFRTDSPSGEVLDHFGFSHDILPEAVPSFSIQGHLLPEIASELGLKEGIPVSYRAGDQPNNALSLNVLNPGEVAATAGTSGVIYGVTDSKSSDPFSRVNTFLHVNHTAENPRLGVLLCINGTGILNSWVRKITGPGMKYDDMNKLASEVKPGSDGLTILPFGNGSERMLGNIEPGSVFSGINFNTHTEAHIFRAVQEGIAFSFRYGLDIMQQTGISASVMRAGAANMFLSPLFREAVSCVTGSEIDLYNTDGSLGAARGAGLGCGYFKTGEEAFSGLKTVGKTLPDRSKASAYEEAYHRWKTMLAKMI